MCEGSRGFGCAHRSHFGFVATCGGVFVVGTTTKVTLSSKVTISAVVDLMDRGNQNSSSSKLQQMATSAGHAPDLTLPTSNKLMNCPRPKKAVQHTCIFRSTGTYFAPTCGRQTMLVQISQARRNFLLPWVQGSYRKLEWSAIQTAAGLNGC